MHACTCLRRVLIPVRLLAFCFASIVGMAQPADRLVPADWLPLQQLERDDFEPAVGEQIRLAYKKTIENPQDAELVGGLGMILQCYHKYELAELCYRRASALSPRSMNWIYYLGNLLGLRGKTQDAIHEIREALKIDDAYTPARVRLAQLLFESGELQNSLEEYQKSLQQNSTLATAYLGLGRLQAAQGAWADAIASYQKACSLFQDYAAAHYGLGMSYRKIGDDATSRLELELYQRSKKKPQPSEDPLLDTVNALYAGGNIHFANGTSLAQQGKLTQAAEEFESALKVNPRLMMAHVNLIAAYGRLGRADRAEAHFREAVKLDPGWVELYYNWALVLTREQRIPEAIEAFKKALDVNPNYVNAHLELGQILTVAGSISESQRHLRLGVENAPANREARYLLGSSLLSTGQIEEAIAHLAQSIKIEDDKTAICMQTLAVAYERAGDLDKALYYTRAARERAVSRQLNDLAAQLEREIDRLAGEVKAP
jgi:tetratricopeptide (TPR) repeat protein